jgi:hypothetical protein
VRPAVTGAVVPSNCLRPYFTTGRSMAVRYRHLVYVVVGLVGMFLLGCAQQPALVKAQAK